jgi:cell division septation protein DedD
VTHDENGNGKADPNEPPLDGAVVVLDGGARSEQVRKGRYRFEAVRSGAHLVRLLVDSLPDGARIAGDPEVPAMLARDALTADVSFVVAVEKRPEIRRVFPPRGGLAASASAPSRSTAETRATASTRRTSPPTATEKGAGTFAAKVPAPYFAVQIAALNDALRAKELVDGLKSAGMPAYLVEPGPEYPDSLYRVRVGPYESRVTAEKAASTLQRRTGEKPWVTREH